MSKYPRTDEGFAQALEATARLARLHPDKQYALIVDRSSPDWYSSGLASLMREEDVEPGTRANIIDAKKNMTPMFQKD